MDATLSAQGVQLTDLTAWKGSANATMLANEKGVGELRTAVANLQKADVDLDARLDKAEPVLVALATRLDQNEAKDKGQDTTDASLAARTKLMEDFKASVAQTLNDYAARLAKLEQPKPIVMAEGSSDAQAPA
jgi:hypothetical protein